MIINSKFILTDSGGLQREAFFLKKISFILRDRSEWVELSNNKFSFIINSNLSKINFKNIKFSNGKTKIFSNTNFKIKILNLVKKILK